MVSLDPVLSLYFFRGRSASLRAAERRASGAIRQADRAVGEPAQAPPE
jgi:hypothetical protein